MRGLPYYEDRAFRFILLRRRELTITAASLRLDAASEEQREIRIGGHFHLGDAT